MPRIILWVGLWFLLPQAAAYANMTLEARVNELNRAVQELRQTVAVQQKEIEILKTSQTITGPASVSSPALPSRPSSASGGRWNPDIGVIADMLFTHDTPREDTEGADRVSVRELELVMGSYVDPYSRLDVNIAFSDFEDVEVQEAYLTRFGLPWETTARIGRSKPKVGKALVYHRDILDTADYPLVVRRYFGLDGLNKTGVDFTKPLDLPFQSAHEISAGVIEGGNGEEGTAFGTARRRPTAYSHLKNFWDITDVTNFELGASHMIGSKDEDAGFETNVLGLDGTLLHYYGAEHRLKLQSELFHLNRADARNPNQLGAYGLFDVRFHKQWASGVRVDYADLVEDQPGDRGGSDTGFTGYLTFFQTEFARWRVQYSHIRSTSGKDDDQVMIQGIFAIGEHKHKLA